MFDLCLQILLNELNQYIQRKTHQPEERVSFTSLDAAALAITPKKTGTSILMRLVHIVREELGSSTNTYIPQGNSYIIRNQPLSFHIYVLFSTYAEETLAGIRDLVHVIAFFQSKNYFTTRNTPALQQADIDSLSVEFVNLDDQAKNTLWSSLGVPYTPSVLYKMGTLSIEDTEMTTWVPGITEVI